MIKDSSMRKEIPKNDRLWRENLFDLGERRGGASCTLIVPEEATLETSPDRVEGQNSQLLFRGVENPCPVPFIRAIFGSQVTNIHGLQQRLWKTSSRFPFFFFLDRIFNAEQAKQRNRDSPIDRVRISTWPIRFVSKFSIERFSSFETVSREERATLNINLVTQGNVCSRKLSNSSVRSLSIEIAVSQIPQGGGGHYNIRARFTGRNLSVEWKARNGRGNAMVN